MNSYITLDGKKYKCAWKAWQSEFNVPSSIRLLVGGGADVVYGTPDIVQWSGEIEAPVKPDDTLWGAPSDLRTSLLKHTTLSFTDHYGTSYTVKAQGPFKERSLGPRWDADTNVIFFSVSLISVT